MTVHQHGQASDRYAAIGHVRQLRAQIFVDTSSVEIFINDGAAAFTERYYNDNQRSRPLWLPASQPPQQSKLIFDMKG
ncbi:MAG: GH32 C-terminal domain-containing protein [Limosilactobacillus pontis]